MGDSYRRARYSDRNIRYKSDITNRSVRVIFLFAISDVACAGVQRFVGVEESGILNSFLVSNFFAVIRCIWVLLVVVST